MNLFPILFTLFLIVPVVEIFLLIEIGSEIGAIWTILLIVGTAMLGATLVRHQGLTTLQRLNDAMRRGQVPAIEMFEGIALLVAGALLLTPGFFTDAIGFLLLVPPLRQFLILRLFRNKRPDIQGTAYRRPNQDAIEGEFHRDD